MKLSTLFFVALPFVAGLTIPNSLVTDVQMAGGACSTACTRALDGCVDTKRLGDPSSCIEATCASQPACADCFFCIDWSASPDEMHILDEPEAVKDIGIQAEATAAEIAKEQVPEDCLLCEFQIRMQCAMTIDKTACVNNVCSTYEHCGKGSCGVCQDSASKRRAPVENVPDNCILCELRIDSQCSAAKNKQTCRDDVCSTYEHCEKGGCGVCQDSALNRRAPAENVPEPCILCMIEVKKKCSPLDGKACRDDVCSTYEHCENGTCPVCDKPVTERRAPVENVPEPCILCTLEIRKKCSPLDGKACRDDVCSTYEHCENGTCPVCDKPVTERRAPVESVPEPCIMCKLRIMDTCENTKGPLAKRCRDRVCFRYEHCEKGTCPACQDSAAEVDSN